MPIIAGQRQLMQNERPSFSTQYYLVSDAECSGLDDIVPVFCRFGLLTETLQFVIPDNSLAFQLCENSNG